MLWWGSSKLYISPHLITNCIGLDVKPCFLPHTSHYYYRLFWQMFLHLHTVTADTTWCSTPNTYIFHLITSLGTLSNALLISTNPKQNFLPFTVCLMTNIVIVPLSLVKPNCISSVSLTCRLTLFKDAFNHFHHGMLCVQTTVIGITLKLLMSQLMFSTQSHCLNPTVWLISCCVPFKSWTRVHEFTTGEKAFHSCREVENS